MSGFSNPIIGGGGALVYPSIHSPNYITAVSGWTINKNGSAEFSSVTIRGAQVISGTQLFYNGTPASGNLIASVSAAAGTDSFGNDYFAGIASYGTGGRASLNDNELDFPQSPSSTATQARIFGTPGLVGITSGVDAGDGGTRYTGVTIIDDDTFHGNGSAGVVIATSASNGVPIRSMTTLLELQGRLGLTDQGSDPATPSGGGILYCKAGALWFKGSGGTVTKIANA